MLISVVQYFWPSINKEEARKFGILALALLCLIGCYWMLRILKDTIFFKVAFPEELGWAAHQGGDFQPIAKMLSPFVVILSILVYTRLVDLYKKHELFYIIGAFYATVFGAIAAVLFVKSMFGAAFLGKYPLAAVGWVSYLSIESFGSVMIPIFWNFVVSITKTESAKVGFPIIVAGAQVGSIAGSALNIYSKNFGGVWGIMLIGCALIIANMFLISYFMKTTPPVLLEGNKVAEKHDAVHPKEGFFESMISGIRLLVTRPYLLGVLLCSTIYEVILTIVDYQMKKLASPLYQSEEAYNEFLGWFGVGVNGLAFVFALLGTSYVMKRFGLRFCLLLYPICLGLALLGLFAYKMTDPSIAQLVVALFIVMMIGKGLSYAVNNPTKEMMYIPTSKDAKFKAKGWVDMFGGRSAKFAGSHVTNMFKGDMNVLMTMGTAISLGLIAFVWFPAAIFVGNKNKQLIDNNEIIE
jgi:AAA family ATP:ADP antiporter